MPAHVQFEVGDAVKVNYLGVDMYGTLKWQGDLPDGEDMAGIEMVSLLGMPRLVEVYPLENRPVLFCVDFHHMLPIFLQPTFKSILNASTELTPAPHRVPCNREFQISVFVQYFCG